MEVNKTSLDTLCAAICEIMGIIAPKQATEPCEELIKYAQRAFDGGCGSHGLDMVEDLNIVHFYKAYASK